MLLHKIAQEHGFVPQIACYVPNEFSFKANLAVGNGIVFADSITDLENKHIKKFTFTNLRNDTILVWKKEKESEELLKFIDLF